MKSTKGFSNRSPSSSACRIPSSPEFRAKSWQIGSGPTEAECKTTTRRVKGRGCRWNTDNAEAMMALATHVC